MTTASRKSVIAAYQRRVEAEITHPIFCDKISYRLTLEIQAPFVFNLSKQIAMGAVQTGNYLSPADRPNPGKGRNRQPWKDRSAEDVCESSTLA
ncbi:hypothetical protein [Thalassoglobus polymorphus]|uniref:Uncharacterized protein n=1 Tax=Thalassoglobus polymorphus TaxID=2527994 RepID=A0A517QL14_9PLAN|nr:hypothetical protein [Thalassoglobus polymorphus]QDT32313.1 hypothetical protein Mal48_15560 [Thalassoglobus polymorphus]